MLFSVIYDFKCDRDVSVRTLYPTNFRKVRDGQRIWWITEKDYDPESFSKQRKLCAVLTKKEFEQFLSDCNLYPENARTMGSIGAPGLGFGCSPAISFTGVCDEYMDTGAYVTPIPEVNRKNGFTERDWERLRKVIIERYF